MLASTAAGDPLSNATVDPGKVVHHRLVTVPGPEMPRVAPAALAGHTIYLNRCIGGANIF